jgi:transporter family-2 protein
LGYEKKPFNLVKCVGVACTLAGGLMIQDFNASQNDGVTICYGVILAIFTGLIQPLQIGLNTKLRKNRLNNDTTISTLFYFTVGTIVLFIAYAFTLISTDFQFNKAENNWWCWLGGLAGIVYISVGTTIPSRLGLSAFFMCIIAGQLTMSELSDVFGLFGNVRERSKEPIAISGLTIAFIGAAIITIAKNTQSTPNNTNNQTILQTLPNSTLISVAPVTETSQNSVSTTNNTREIETG